jgi:hypothetical protein
MMRILTTATDLDLGLAEFFMHVDTATFPGSPAVPSVGTSSRTVPSV